ncbi:MAG: hypothetical protein QOC99_3687 [Acidobacteriota bacterium]|jgi:hypothetical protein|nr:hypothetical protein [Acidobacteriota bacterium]MDT7781175.1 hypothetical protein [Acidobacteriota bacterium]
MSKDKKEYVNTNSSEFKQGVEAGLNSEEDTKNWKAGNELGQELKDESEVTDEGEVTEPIYKVPFDTSSTPLFLRDSPDGQKGDAQDEKDEMEE